jgi:GH24 family phage-related lysozyme (muramidase)
MKISDKSIALILESEGVDQPWKWPGGGSGITLGYGSDIGADFKALDNWRGVLSEEQIQKLEQARGVTGRAAAQIASRFRSITVTREQALKVFTERTLPRWIKATEDTFPGVELLPEDARGALVSLVFNRGTSLVGPRRAEMENIHEDLLKFRALDEAARPSELPRLLDRIAIEIRKMKRLWQGQGLDGLITRRDNEARLVASALT